MTPNPHLGDELSALLDGELDDAERDAVQAHLRECAFCTSELAAIDRTRSLVRALPMVDPPNALHPRQEHARRRPFGMVAAAAAAVVLVMLQAIPVSRSVSPSLAGLVQVHAAQAADLEVVPVASKIPLAGKYTVVTVLGPSAADPQTVEVEVVDTRSGKLVEKASLDSQTRSVLWHELYDEDGNVVPRPQGAGATASSHTGSVGPLIPTPARLDGDYQRVGVYRRGEVVHQLFSDGLHTLSVFAEAGALDDDDLPGRAVTLRGHRVVVWESGGVVFTAVGDGPVEDVRAAAASMPEPRKLSAGERLRRGCRALADALAGD